MQTLDVCAGIGGLSLGLEWAGCEAVGFVEQNPFCREALAKHWPGVWQHEDLRTCTGDAVARACGPIDLLAGGPPCQPASLAGKRGGHSDPRWLWGHFLRLVREVLPRWVLAENPLGLVTLEPLGLDWILAELQAAGYETAPPLVFGAEHLGAPHQRARVWIVARRVGDAGRIISESGGSPSQRNTERRTTAEWAGTTSMGDAESSRRACEGQRGQPQVAVPVGGSAELANTYQSGRGGHDVDGRSRTPPVADADREPVRQQSGRLSGQSGTDSREPGAARYRWPAFRGEPQHEWEPTRTTTLAAEIESAMGAAADGTAERLARWRWRQSIQAIGNSVSPPASEAIGRAIIAADRGVSQL